MVLSISITLSIWRILSTILPICSRPFVWNATNITKDTRQKQIGLFERYGARVRVVYLETDWNTQKERNCSREAEVPMQAVEKMLGKTVLPTTEEAHKVEWICV